MRSLVSHKKNSPLRQHHESGILCRTLGCLLLEPDRAAASSLTDVAAGERDGTLVVRPRLPSPDLSGPLRMLAERLLEAGRPVNRVVSWQSSRLSACDLDREDRGARRSPVRGHRESRKAGEPAEPGPRPADSAASADWPIRDRHTFGSRRESPVLQLEKSLGRVWIQHSHRTLRSQRHYRFRRSNSMLIAFELCIK